MVGTCASRSTFERVYKSFPDRHPQLLLHGSLANQMLTRMIIFDPRRRPFSASKLERPSELERKEVSQSILDSLYETTGASGPTPRDATRFYTSNENWPVQNGLYGQGFIDLFITGQISSQSGSGFARLARRQTGSSSGFITATTGPLPDTTPTSLMAS